MRLSQTPGGQAGSGVEEERLRRIIRANIWDNLPHDMAKSSKFLKLKKAVFNEIDSRVRETVGHQIRLTEYNPSPRYSVPTCAGSSGTGIQAVLVRSGEKRRFYAIHSAGSCRYNIGGVGGYAGPL